MRRCRAGWAPPAGGMRFTVLRIPRVRARKPNSLALRAGGRELRRPASSFFRIFRSTVRARKPSSLALRAGGREPRRPASSFFRIFRSTVRARKPSSLALRAGVREPHRPAGCVQMKEMHGRLRRPPCISSHYYISKRNELTTNSHSRLVVVNSNHPSLPPALICILCHQKLTTDDRPSVFLLPRPHLALSLGHLALIYPAAAGKLTTQLWGGGFRRQFPPLLRDRSKLEVFHGYLYGGSQQRFRSNSYS